MRAVRVLAAVTALSVAPGSGRSAQTPVPSPGAAAPPPATATATPAPANLAAVANMRWEGLVRRNAGVVVLKSRWDLGVLEFRQETVRWSDAKDPGKNLLIPGSLVKEQFKTCEKTSRGPECFEWGFKTAEATFVFRDDGWQKGAHEKVAEIYEFMKAIYPSLPARETAGTR